MDKDYYYTEQEWAKVVGYGEVPADRQAPKADEHWNPFQIDYRMQSAFSDCYAWGVANRTAANLAAKISRDADRLRYGRWI